ncbi:MAG TPA: hypothetical protein PK640_15245 [Verrucomicrobiota bacterium]|nr:hypothetical protein [Verrucomicrobiota bacterium]
MPRLSPSAGRRFFIKEQCDQKHRTDGDGRSQEGVIPGDRSEFPGHDRAKRTAHVDHRVEEAEPERLVARIGGHADRARDQRFENPRRQTDAQHRQGDARKGLRQHQQQDGWQVGEIRNDQHLLEPEPIGERPGDQRNGIREQQEKALYRPQFILRVSEMRQIDPKAKVDSVVSEPLEHFDDVRHPEDRRE